MYFCGSFFGLIFNYLIFLLFFPPVKENKLADDGSIIENKIANIFANIFIIFDFILIGINLFIIFQIANK